MDLGNAAQLRVDARPAESSSSRAVSWRARKGSAWSSELARNRSQQEVLDGAGAALLAFGDARLALGDAGLRARFRGLPEGDAGAADDAPAAAHAPATASGCAREAARR